MRRNTMKTAATLFGLLALLLAVPALAAETSPLRYFAQPPDVSGSAAVIGAGTLEPGYFKPDAPKAWRPAFLDNFPVTWAAIEPFLPADLDTLQGAKKLERNTVK